MSKLGFFLFANQLRHGIIAIGEFRQNRMVWFRQSQQGLCIKVFFCLFLYILNKIIKMP